MDRRWMVGPLWLVALAACETGGQAQALGGGMAAGEAQAEVACTVAAAGTALPDEVRETSGLARSGRNPALFWTHNDAGNAAELYAIDASGQLAQRVRIAGAEATDWEDIEAGSCESGSCLYIGDIGDNDGERARITIYRIVEPEARATESAAAVALHARFPDGPRDAESLFRLPSGDMFVVTKGRAEPVTLYRYPAPDRPGETVTLERVRDLFPEAHAEEDRVTAATASPDGRWVGIRSYRNLYLYRSDQLTGGGPVEPAVVALQQAAHGQGEALVLSSEGEVWLTGEAVDKDAGPLWARLQCTLPGG